MVSLDTLLDVPLLPMLPLGPPIPLAMSCVPTASSLRSLRPHPHRASCVPGSLGVTHTMAHITPSWILQMSPCFIHVFQLFNDSPPACGLQSDRYQIAILWYFLHQHCLYVGLWPYCTVNNVGLQFTVWVVVNFLLYHTHSIQPYAVTVWHAALQAL